MLDVIGFLAYTTIISVPLALFVRWRIRLFRRSKASWSWPTVEGTVDSVKWVWTQHSDTTDGDNRMNVEYRYVVGDTVYRSWRMTFTGEYDEDAERRRVRKGATRNQFREGGKVTVYYDPNDPREVDPNRWTVWRRG